ncbi:hypothetical protein LB503_000710 [Fusarium chuoi]|nr:hypothetical protein LB503_000710 [Fusarium chuoi]
MLYLLHITSHHFISLYALDFVCSVTQAHNPGEDHSTGMRWNRRTGQWYRTKSWGKGVQKNQKTQSLTYGNTLRWKTLYCIALSSLIPHLEFEFGRLWLSAVKPLFCGRAGGCPAPVPARY